MAKPIANLGGLVQLDQPTSSAPENHTLAPKPASVPRAPKPTAPKLKKAGFLVHPEALKQFDILRAELAGDDRRTAGPRLMHEALNLLFQKHGKPTIRLEV